MNKKKLAKLIESDQLFKSPEFIYNTIKFLSGTLTDSQRGLLNKFINYIYGIPQGVENQLRLRLEDEHDNVDFLLDKLFHDLVTDFKYPVYDMILEIYDTWLENRR